MTWDEFIFNLSKAKQEKRIVGNVMSAFMNLLYFGALDSIIGKDRISLKEYDQKLEEIKTSLKSKSQKPKKKKNEDIGLADVKDDLLLGFWRYQNNPIAKFDLKPFVKNFLESKGFVFLKNKDIRGFAKLERDVRDLDQNITKDITYITENFQIFFDNPALKKLFLENKGKREIEDGSGFKLVDHFKIGVLGMVVSKNITLTKNGVEKMSVVLFTGQEKTSEIIFWPPKGEAELPKDLKNDIRKLNVYVFFINLNEYKGAPSANVRTLYSKKKNKTLYSYFKVLEYISDKENDSEKEKGVFSKNSCGKNIKSVI